MSTFIWVIVALLCLDVVGKIIILVKQDFVRNPKHIGWDLFFGFILIVWGILVLVGAI